MSAATRPENGEEGDRPVLRVVRGDASPEEVAALVAVLAAAGRAPRGEDAPPSSSTWGDRRAAVRADLPHGPGAWRASFWPR